MQKPIHSRNPAMDVVRCFALFCVISVHFFLNIGFYNIYLVGSRTYIMTLLRNGFMICVPLFLLLSGYLMKNKTVSRKYYVSLSKTISIYLLVSVICFVFDAFYHERTYSISSALYTFVKNIFNYNAAVYSWYIEMYIGLYLMIPFLNVLYNNLPSQKHKQALLLILFLLSSAQTLGNTQWMNPNWWMNPTIPADFTLLPTWWISLYPIAYYFMGAYLREYPLKLKKRTNLVLLFTLWLCTGSYRYLCSNGGTLIGEPWPTYGTWPLFLMSTLTFNFLAQIDYHFLTARMRRILAHSSDACLGAYLISSIFDTVFYNILNQHQPSVSYRLNYFPVIVPAVYVSSLACSAILNMILEFFKKRCHSLRSLKISCNK